MTSNPTYEFNHAIVRQPAVSVTNGLRATNIGDPDLSQLQSDHNAYVAALKETGATVIELEALEEYPDSLFVEDDVLCLPQGAILMRPGAPTRLGEVDQIAPTIMELFGDVRRIEDPGFIEAGDILVTSKEILVGRSARTNSEGIAALQELVRDWGYSVREVVTPPGVLHFKTDCSLLDSDTILSTKRLSASGCFSQYNLIHTAEGEEAAANTIRFNELVIMPAGFPQTAETLREAGYNVREINNTECAKLDGGMSCLSLRFSI